MIVIETVFSLAPFITMTQETHFGISLSPKDFEERFLTLHKQLYSSKQFAFDDVTQHVYAPPAGMLQVDHSFIYDGQNWHLFYATGFMADNDAYIAAIKKRDFEAASRLSLEAGNGHAVGPDLFSLEFQEHLQFESLGRFDWIARGVGNVFHCDLDQPYGFLYDVKGDEGGKITGAMNLAWSSDLDHWQLSDRNPIHSPPAWTIPGSPFKDPHVMEFEGVYLIYYVSMDQRGYPSIGLTTTKDWETFSDEGAVFSLPSQLRGTMGIESPQVIHREGIWHLFFTYGEGLQHAISPSPFSFVGARDSFWNVGTGFYNIGPFHATEIIQDGDHWWLSTDRKEETRRLNRFAGKLCYRGTQEDEQTLLEGLYLSRIQWAGDQPTLVHPGR